MLIRVLSIIVLTLGLGVLALFWMVTVPKKLGIPVYFKTGGFWRVLVGTLIVGLSVLSSTRFPFPPQQFDIFIILTGITLYITGSLLAIAAKLTMSDRWGMPAGHDHQRQNKLFTNGPFAISRNPIYTGLLLIFFGYSLAIKSVFIFLIIPYYLLILNYVKKEEILLEKYFGQKYLVYKSQVPRFLGLKY